MKATKKCISILLSAILMIGLLPCSVFADSIPDELICEGYFDSKTTYRYGGVMRPGENTFSDLEEDTAYFFSFVPEQTGVYCFGKEVKGITADTDDNRCRVEEFEDLLTLYTEGYESRSDYSLLTAGTTYYVLVDFFEDVVISFEGAVTDVDPSIPLVDLVKDWDVLDVEAGFIDGRALDVEWIVKLSSNKTLYGWGFYFDPGDFTEDSVTWKHLGFEKTFSYNTINIKDLVSSVEAKNSIDFVKYFDGRIEFAESVTLTIRFSDGTSTEVVIEDYDYYYTFPAANGREYRVYLDIDDDGELAAWIAGSDFGSMDYTIKRVGFFKDILYYFQRIAAMSKWYRGIMTSQPCKTKILLLLENIKDIGNLRMEFVKSLFMK
ncbi:MAG: hypothetical protein IJT44_10895 [Clostridia bacterium]|nr:hypothetical protein [Clostridia bacterium]